jgi:RyR domain
MNIHEIARVAHEVNRAYCQALGDQSQPAWEDAPEWQRASAITGVRMHVRNPEAGPEASHEAWLDEKIRTGWRYGSIKDPVAKTHPCMLPFDALPAEQQAKDFIFRAVVRALAPTLPIDMPLSVLEGNDPVQ